MKLNKKEYFIAILTHNKIQLIANGHSKIEVDTKLKDSLRLLFISADMFNQKQGSGEPSYFLNLAQEVFDFSVQDNKYNFYNVSYLGELFERNKKISELSNKEIPADNSRGWACLWEIANNNSTGILGEVPTIEDQRWLITDTGFFITKENPFEKYPQNIEQKKSSIIELICQFDVAFKYGASLKVLQLFADIIKKNIADFNQSKGDFTHLSIEELEEKLERQMTLDRYNDSVGMKFIVKGPTAEELKKIISLRKEFGIDKGEVNNFVISDNLQKYMNLSRKDYQ